MSQQKRYNLSAENVQLALPMDEAIDAMGEAFTQLQKGQVTLLRASDCACICL